MVAVPALSQTGGGELQRAIASPSTRVESTRDSIISRRLPLLYRQFTDRPARLIRARAPSSSLAQSPSVCPSHPTWQIDCTDARGDRVRTTTSLFPETSDSVSKLPMKPLPPATTMRFSMFRLRAPAGDYLSKRSCFDLSVSSICGHNNTCSRTLTFKKLETGRHRAVTEEPLPMSNRHRIYFQTELVNEIIL